MHRKTPIRARLLAAVAILACAPSLLAQPQPLDPHAFDAEMRRQWEDHITWTRLYIVSALADLPDKDATAQRLLRNQADLGAAIEPFYGAAAGERLTTLLRDHILIATEVVGAAKAGDEAKQDAATTRWSANADDIATFLSGANPKNWPLADAKAMMHDHLKLTTEEVVAHLKKDWAGSVAAYDRVHEQALHMADMLSSGIRAQFPDKFRS
jgi:hypothetical protein